MHFVRTSRQRSCNQGVGCLPIVTIINIQTCKHILFVLLCYVYNGFAVLKFYSNPYNDKVQDLRPILTTLHSRQPNLWLHDLCLKVILNYAQIHLKAQIIIDNLANKNLLKFVEKSSNHKK